MTEQTKLRLRVRPLAKAEDWEVANAWSNRLCLSVPHVGEAIDFASDHYRVRSAERDLAALKKGEHQRGRILHYGHELGLPCGSADEESKGRCLFLDYVPVEIEKGEHELEVAGLVAAGRAG